MTQGSEDPPSIVRITVIEAEVRSADALQRVLASVEKLSNGNAGHTGDPIESHGPAPPASGPLAVVGSAIEKEDLSKTVDKAEAAVCMSRIVTAAAPALEQNKVRPQDASEKLDAERELKDVVEELARRRAEVRTRIQVQSDAHLLEIRARIPVRRRPRHGPEAT